MTAVLVVDDQAVFRRAAVALVRSVAEFDLVGQADSGESAVALAEQTRPDLVVMDIRLPGIDGIEATSRILGNHPHTRVVLISTHEASDLPAGLGGCGAVAFVRKQDLDSECLRLAAGLPPAG